MEFVSLELELSVERLKRYLQQHPEKAAELAVSYFEDFSVLAIEHKKLEADFEQLQSDSIKRNSVFPPSFLNLKRGVS